MINEKIKEAIRDRLPLSFGKLGNIEAMHVSQYLTSRYLRPNPSLFINAGIYAMDQRDFQLWLDDYIESIKDLDYVLQWCKEQGDQFILDKVWNGKGIFHDFKELEPYTHEKEGWHYSLSDKRLLFVSPFSDTVQEQAKIYHKIWDQASIGEVITVRSPYSEALTGEEPAKWVNKLNNMIDEIRELDFDFATVGCGGFSLSVCKFIKSMGKPCVHLGGGNQLLFGIKGKRWDEHPVLSKFYNEHWVRPLAHEIPKNNELVEGGCYW